MFKRSDVKEADTPQPKEAHPVSSNAVKTSSQAPSIIGSDVRLKGNLVTSGEVQFDGAIEGDLQCGALTIGESAEVSGNVIADMVVVHGKVSGTIRAKNVRLERGSKVLGDILHEDLAVASGAHIEGHLKRVENAAAKTKPAASPAPAQPASNRAAE
jgi:cytoskeletal protein CcmA (bactofilin family)